MAALFIDSTLRAGVVNISNKIGFSLVDPDIRAIAPISLRHP